MKMSGEISNQAPYFVGKAEQALYIEDDHIPFLEKGNPTAVITHSIFTAKYFHVEKNEKKGLALKRQKK